VLRKALEAGAKPIVVINKIDRENATPHLVLDWVFDLFVSLHATDEQLDFPVVYASAKDGYAKINLTAKARTWCRSLTPSSSTSPRAAHAGTNSRCCVANLDYSDYLGESPLERSIAGKAKVGRRRSACTGGRKTEGKLRRCFILKD